MNRIKKNKKGVFFSLTVILFLVLLLIIFNTKSELQKKEDEFHIQRVQIIVMDHFVRDFDRYYAKTILETAAKPALVALTPSASVPFSKADVVSMMKNGLPVQLTTDDNFQQSLGTLTFTLDEKEFDFRLESFEQPRYDTIQLNFLVNYSFKMTESNWSKTDKQVIIPITVYGLYHPTYLEVIDDSWLEDTADECYINEIFSSPPSCSGMNIMPQPPAPAPIP
ncbi:hypothetical protein AYK26_06590 [Euryarchaeota archaeon SM23-78]|nr:MAG: hypothetical protein AYK26_06590 [Euryarchaeota archaeon SM23-78]MBW3000932.1 hypothetical protein [Candidatus Woesearchaeota archaeon]